jgi:serine/threonine protein kinase
MASLATEAENVTEYFVHAETTPLEMRGVSLEIFSTVLNKLRRWNEAQRYYCSGVSGLRLESDFQKRELDDKNKILRSTIQLTEQQWEKAIRIDAAVGDRVEYNDSYATVTNVAIDAQSKVQYTITPLTDDSYAHEANYASWAWNETRNVVTHGVTRDLTATTKDAMEEITKADTIEKKESYISMLAKTEKEFEHCVQPANIFISHAWKYKFEDVVECLIASVDYKRAYLWFDIFTVNQHFHDNDRPFEWWKTEFHSAVAKIGKTMVVLSPWESPIPLKRCWVLWEILCTVMSASKLQLIMSEKEKKRFLKTLYLNYPKIESQLCQITTKEAKAGNPVDQEKIMKAAGEMGFAKIDSTCKIGIRKALYEMGREELDKVKNEGKNEKVYKLMNQLAALCHHQENDKDAMRILREALEGCEKENSPSYDKIKIILKHSLAELLRVHEKDYFAAKELSKEVYDTRMETLGNGTVTLQSKHDYAVSLLAYSEYGLENSEEAKCIHNDAEHLLRDVYNSFKDKFGINDVRTLSSLDSLAGAISKSSPKEAKAFYFLVYNERTKLLTLDHPDVVTSAFNYGNFLYENSNDLESLYEAKRYLNEAYDRRYSNYGSDHEKTKKVKYLLQEVEKKTKPLLSLDDIKKKKTGTRPIAFSTELEVAEGSAKRHFFKDVVFKSQFAVKLMDWKYVMKERYLRWDKKKYFFQLLVVENCPKMLRWAWKIKRCYSDFVAFRSNLNKFGFSSTHFPEKTYPWTTVNHRFLSCRMESLNRWLRDVILWYNEQVHVEDVENLLTMFLVDNQVCESDVTVPSTRKMNDVKTLPIKSYGWELQSQWETIDTLGSVRIEEKIGPSNSKVFKVKHKKLPESMVLVDSEYKPPQIAGKQSAESGNAFLLSVNHPFITPLRGVYHGKRTQLLLNYCSHGELKAYLIKLKESKLPEDLALFYTAEIASALGELHSYGIVYRGFQENLESIFLDHGYHIQLTDVGIHPASIAFLAPEILSLNKGQTFASDWWALGVLLYEMVTGKKPYYSNDKNLMKSMICCEDKILDTEDISSPHLKELIKSLLQRNPAERLREFNKIREHAAFEEAGLKCRGDWDMLIQKKLPLPPSVRCLKEFDSSGNRSQVEVDETHCSFVRVPYHDTPNLGFMDFLPSSSLSSSCSKSNSLRSIPEYAEK